MINGLVKYYVKRFDRELDQVRYHTPRCQSIQLGEILRTPLVRLLNPEIQEGCTEGEFKSAVGISTYAKYAEAIDKLKGNPPHKIHYYAQSSGTTGGKKKLIPTPESFVRSNHLRGSWYNLNTLYNHVPDMNVFSAKNLLIGGAIYERRRDYVIGDVSGIMLNRIPQFFRPYYVPKISEAILPDWQQKLEITIRKATQSRDISLLAGVPTWVITVLSGVQNNIAPRSLAEHWPNLKAYLHGGVNMEPYMDQLKKLIDLPDFKFIEIYNATEGFFAFQDNPDEEGMLLMTHSGVYFEFIRYLDYSTSDSPEIIGFEEVKEGERYVLLISTQTGLLRYVIGDIITFVSIAPYKIKVVGRISEYVNAFGEDLMLCQAREALLKVSQRHTTSIAHYTVAPKYISIDEQGWHDWAIEFERAPSDLTQFAADLDVAIQDLNNNYAQKRYQSIAMEQLRIYPLKAGSFSAYLKQIGKQGGQSKVQKLRNDRAIMDILLGANHV